MAYLDACDEDEDSNLPPETERQSYRLMRLSGQCLHQNMEVWWQQNSELMKFERTLYENDTEAACRQRRDTILQILKGY